MSSTIMPISRCLVFAGACLIFPAGVAIGYYATISSSAGFYACGAVCVAWFAYLGAKYARRPRHAS